MFVVRFAITCVVLLVHSSFHQLSSRGCPGKSLSVLFFYPLADSSFCDAGICLTSSLVFVFVCFGLACRLTNRKYYVMAERGQLQLEYRQRSPFNNNNNYAGSYERAAAAILRLSPEQIGEILALGDPMFPQHTSCLITRKEFKINNGGFNGLAGDTEAPVTKTLSVYLSFERTFIFEMSFAATAESPEISGKLHCTVGQTKVLRELMTAAIPVLHCWQTLPTLKLGVLMLPARSSSVASFARFAFLLV